MDIEIDFTLPSVAEFNALRGLVGWRLMSEQATKNALDGSLLCCCARNNSHLLGFGRIIGDGAMYYYLQDVMIHPEHQNKGIGKVIMQHLESWLTENMQSGATAALLAAHGKEGFYSTYGYSIRPGSNTGAGMSKFIS